VFNRPKLTHLFRTYDHRLRHSLASYGDSARDAVQQTWLTTLRSNNHAGSGSIYKWLQRIALHHVINQHRSQARLEYVVQDKPLPATQEQRMILDQSIVRVFKTMASLTRDQQMAVLLVDFCSTPVDETAAALHCTTSALRARLGRARSFLRVARASDSVPGMVILPNEYMPYGIDEAGHAWDVYHETVMRHKELSEWTLIDSSCMHSWSVRHRALP